MTHLIFLNFLVNALESHLGLRINYYFNKGIEVIS